MFKKKIIIFISVFIIVGIIILIVSSLLKKKGTTTTNTETPWYQGFNPFGSGSNTVDNNINTNTDNTTETPDNTAVTSSKFTQITDFAIAGATFLEDTRSIGNEGDNNQPQEVKVIISASTVEGRKEIQTILNETLSPSPKLTVDGVFGKSATQAIKDFQKLNNIPLTGTIDETTAPYFTKISTNQTRAQFEKAPSIRFAQSMNGHIYKMFLDTKEKEKISNSTIPGIHEAFFDNTGNTVAYRYSSDNKVISSFIATLGAQKGEFLPQNIYDFSISPDKTKFFYLTKNTSGSTGTIGTFTTTKRDIIFNSPLTEWVSDWDTNQNLFITTKPSYSVAGSMFKVNIINNTISKVLGGLDGLTTKISPKGDVVLYSTFTSTGPGLFAFNIKNHTTKDMGTSSLPEKCIWSSDNINIYCAVPNVIVGNQYPDSWYQGLESFDDYFIKIDTTTGDRDIIANSSSGIPVDGTYLFLNKTEDTIFFTNKKDSTLWSLDLK